MDDESGGTINTANDLASAVEICTAQLRIYGEGQDAQLQQLWQVHPQGGPLREEWRPVPVVTTEPAGEPEEC